MALSAPSPVALKIGEVARRSGLPIKTIRCYRVLHTELEDLLSRWQDCGGRKGSAA